MRLNSKLITEIRSDSRQFVINVWIEGLSIYIVEGRCSEYYRSWNPRNLCRHRFNMIVIISVSTLFSVK